MEIEASPYTRLFWNEYQLDQERSDYNCVSGQTIEGDLEIGKLSNALVQLVKDHLLINSHLIDDDGKLYWQQNGTIEKLQLFDSTDQEQPFVHQSFNIEQGPLYRFGLFKRGQNCYDLIMILHHVLIDGSSMDDFVGLVSNYYNDQYKTVNLDEQADQIRESNQKFIKRVNDITKFDAKEYWEKALIKLPAKNELPYVSQNKQNINQVGEYRFELLKNDLLENLTKKLKTTLFTVLSSIWGALIAKYINNDSVHIAYPIEMKEASDFIYGGQINTVILPIRLSNSITFETLIEQSNQHIISYKINQECQYSHLPINEIVSGLEVRSLNVSMAQANLESRLLDFKNCQISNNQGYNIDIAGSELLLEYEELKSCLNFRVRYQSQLFSQALIKQISQHYLNLVLEAIKKPHAKLSEFSLLTKAEYQQIVIEWNKTDKEYPKDKTIYQLFEEQVLRIPDNIAVVFEEHQLTYAALNSKANQLANYLQSQITIKPDNVIALCLDRSLEMIIGILGIMKAGGAYVPIDPEYPAERINYIIDDTETELVLTQSHLVERLQKTTDVNLIELDSDCYQDQEKTNLPIQNKFTDLVYVIYTSGTTGKPKGVMVEHASVCNYINNIYNYFENINNIDFSSNLSFDLSVTTTLLPLAIGKRICIYGDKLTNINKYLEHINDNKIDFIKSTPSFLSQVPFGNLLHKVNSCFIGGEKCDTKQLEYLKNYIDNVYDEYGPTEATVGTTNILHLSVINSIGKAYNNYRIYILDVNNIPTPVGVIGELHIGGAGLARGYLNKEKLTAQKFIPNPFGTNDDIAKGYTILYKTGDLVRWLPDGNIEYLGRNDFQVKIRGYRIELGEIENVLTSIENVKQACVLAKEKNSNKYLVGYFVSNNEISNENILNQLADKLPNYMVPTALVKMDNFPLTVNGKLDRNALPDPDFKCDEDSYVAPEGEFEQKICEIYAQVLGLSVDQISIQQSFFMMGGDSILCIRLKQKLNQINEFAHITVADLFKYNTIQKLVQSIRADHEIEYKLQNFNRTNNHEVAIIGISGAFAGVNNTLELWRLIANQQEGLEFYTEEQCKALGVDELLLQDNNYVPVVSHVKDIDLFDPLFWQMSPNEAKQLDPQIRKFVEHCWCVLESAGYIQSRKSLNIGVFSGSSSNTYFNENIINGEAAENINFWEVSASNIKDALATKPAYLLGLTGPANSINTACSTGLVTVVEACKNLQLGACDMALAGSVSLLMPDQIGYLYQEGMIFSKDGHCRTFDKDSTGTIVGSGIGVVLLKRLEDAIQDKDNIIAVVKGYATNNDGDRKTGYTAPSVIGQSECVINAQKMAEIQSHDLDYVECHGTATNLGDPIEVQALKEAFENNSDKEILSKHKCIIGAVKANIGHAHSAAGIAGLIKVCCMLQNNIIPGQANFNEVNPELHLEATNFEITKHNKPWSPKKSEERLAGVSSFGIGGTNAHVIIGDYSSPSTAGISHKNLSSSEANKRYVFSISAKNRKSLELYRQSLIKYLSNIEIETKGLANIAYTLQERREFFQCRAAYSAQTVDELISKLKKSSDTIKVEMETNNKIIFMFPGQGAQYVEMAKMLCCNEPLFKELLDTCISMANKYLDVDLYQVIYPDLALQKNEQKGKYNINDTQWTQISLFVISYSLTKYLELLKVKADAYIGHSIGEYVAATLAGVFNLEDAIRVVIARGNLMQSMPPGSMLAIQCDQGLLSKLAKEYHCDIAVINSVEDIVVSGEDQAIDLLKEVLDSRGIPSVKLNTSHGYHSRMMDKAANAFSEAFTGIQLNKPGHRQFISNLTGDWADEAVTKPEYWCQQLRNRVEFGKGIETICSTQNNQVSFIEVGTGKALCSLVKKYQVKQNSKTIQAVQLLPSLKETKDHNYQAIEYKEDILAQLWMFQINKNANKQKVFKDNKNISDLPTYQFDYQKCWLAKRESLPAGKLNSKNDMFYERIWERHRRPNSVKGAHFNQYDNVLVLINGEYTEDCIIHELILDLQSKIETIYFVVNGGVNNIRENFTFDFANVEHIENFIGVAVKEHSIKAVIYFSSTTDNENHGLDVIAIHSLFKSVKDQDDLISKFISVSIDNYKILGYEKLENNPSIVYGATKSIPFEFCNRETEVLHVDLASDVDVKDELLYSFLVNSYSVDFIALRGEYIWIPTYKKMNLSDEDLYSVEQTNNDHGVFLIIGGLSGIGYEYAKQIALSNKKNKLVLVGQTKELEIDNDYKERLEYLKSISPIIYVPMEIGLGTHEYLLNMILLYKFNRIDVALFDTECFSNNVASHKTDRDFNEVINPIIRGFNNLIKLSQDIEIDKLINCSSTSSIIPSLKNMEYTAANLYLDEVSYRKYKHVKDVVTINLNQASDTDMGDKSLDFIKPAEFPELLNKILLCFEHQNVVLSKYDLMGTLHSNIKDKNELKQNNISEKDNLSITILEQDYSDSEFKIAQIFCDILGVKEISLEDDFFRIGGNSILAIKLSHQIGKELDLHMAVADIFKYNTVSSLGGYLNLNKTKEIKIIPQNLNKYPLSFAQERLWFIEQYEQGTNAYHIPMFIELEEKTDINKLKTAIQQIIQRHEVLRTNFKEEDGEYYQIVFDSKLKINEYNESEVDINKQMEEDINTPFDLQKDSPIRVSFYHKENRKYLLINIHHIASDGWSTDLLLKEINSFYNDKELSNLAIQYKDYANWQRGYLQEELLQKQLSYWHEQLQGYVPLSLPTDKARPKQINYSGDDIFFNLNGELSNKLRNLSKEQGCSMYTTLLSGFYILLSKYSSQDDIVLGTVVANRHYSGIQDLIGFFVNVLALREDLNKVNNALELVSQVQNNLIEAQRNQDLPFEKMVEELKIEHDTSRHPIFQVTFVVQSMGGDENKLFKSIKFTEKYSIAKFDLSCFLDDSQNEIQGIFNFATVLYEKSTIERMVNHYLIVLEQMVNDKYQQLKDYSLLTEAEYRQIVIDWNKTDKVYPKDKTIYQLFEEQVSKTPDNVALVFENQQLTYIELNGKANQLARYLQTEIETEISSNTLVCLCLDRSLEMIIGILGIMKAGGTYVPIDPEYPIERINYILDDTQTGIVLTQSHLIERLQKITDVNLIELDLDCYQNRETADLPMQNNVTDLAYVIYTSGTTGKPKGACLSHMSLNNLVINQINKFNIKEKDNVLLFASLIFDASISEIFTSVVSGACLNIIAEENRKSSELFITFLAENNINVATIPPVLLSTLEFVELKELKTLIVAGESCPEHLMEKWGKERTFINAYGPTENTVCVTMHEYKDGDLNTNIGKPLNNIKCYVLDANNKPVPIGVIGELSVGGAGLACGYLNKAELIAEMFVPNPFATERDADNGYTRLYKTGDLVRWLPDGNLEYIGRNDFQIKIRGFRVELGEIEQVLESHQNILQACVLYRAVGQNLNQKLIAYYVPKSIEKNDISWWPSVAEYYVYDNLLYLLMTTHETRNECYRVAIRHAVKDRVVVDIGTGPDVILSRICIEEGAKKVYALEYLEETYLKAKKTIEENQLEDKICLIHGDSREITLPEKADVCVSELVGAIGGSEGVAILLNDAKSRHVKPGGKFIPEQSLTKIALVRLPDAVINMPSLDELAYKYTEQIFEQVGYSFDLRLCLKGVSKDNLVSTVDIFEDLDWRNAFFNDPNHTHKINLVVTESAIIYGCLVWMDLVTTEGYSIDILDDQHSWIPVFLPLFPNGIEIQKGDCIEGTVKRYLCDNQLNCDYLVQGELIREKENIKFSYNSTHYSRNFKQNEFYEKFFQLYENYEDLNLDNLGEFMTKSLPDYMIPSAFIGMENFTLTINGKLDRKALPDPEFISEHSYLAPTTDLEIILCDIWQEVLGIKKIGITDDFFRIGGDSILSIQLSSRIRKHNLNCGVRNIFDNKTIQNLAKFIESDISKIEITAEQGILDGQFDLLPIQKWFFDKVNNNQFNKFNHWNQNFLVKVPKLEKGKLHNIIQNLTNHHDILRVVYIDNQQEYLAKLDVPPIEHLNIENLTKEEINNTLTNLQSNFDITKAPLWNITYIEGYEDNSARLFFALHHLIVDSVSWRILIDDFKSLYNNENLEKKSSSYRQWVNEITLYAENEPQEKDYWDNILKTIPQYDVKEKEPACSTTRINKNLTTILLQQANKAYHTEVNDLLLTALALALQSWNKESIQTITLEGHGRENINETIDHSKTVGWFTTMYPVKLELRENLESSIKEIKECLRNIPNKGIGFGAIYPNKLIDLPAISFNYLGQFDTQDEYWQLVSEDAGTAMHADNLDSNIININGMVVEGELSFSVDTKLSKEETVEFANNFKSFLEKIILHCQKIIENNKIQNTPSDFKSVNISQQLLDKLQKDNNKHIEHIFMANSLQQGFIFHALNKTEDDAYRVQTLFDYKQEINLENYVKSWEMVIGKYPILRTAFNWEEEIIQIVYSSAKLNYQFLDITDLPDTKREEYILDLQKRDRDLGFDLTKHCLLRLYIIKQASKHYTIIKSEHHCIADGWSWPPLLNAVHKNYYELQQGRQLNVEVDNSYIEAQIHFAKNKKNVEKYWQTKASTIEHANDLNPFISKKEDLDNIKSLVKSYDTTIEIKGDLYQQLKELSKAEGFTINTILQFAWHKLIQIYTQDNQTIVGTTVSGRDIPISGIEESVGLYINTLPLIINWDNENTVLEQIQYIHQQIIDINTHSFANLVSLQQEGRRLFHSLLVFENYPVHATSGTISNDTLIPEFRYIVEKLDYPLGIIVDEIGGRLFLSVRSDRVLLDAEKANYNLGKIELILSELLTNLDKKHSSISTLTKAEYQQIVLDWNKTDKEYQKDTTIQQLFEEQVLKTPENIALVFEEQQLTYEELNAKANQLARYLQSKITIKPNNLIALCLDRGLEIIIGILGIMKAGGAYVPIDPKYPVERIDYILNDTQTEIVLTQYHLVERLQKITCINLIQLDSDCYHGQKLENLPIQNKATDLAYVIYTSGTTGKPNGCCLSHEKLRNLVSTQKEKLNINEKSNVLQFASIIFDASVWEIFSSLVFGAVLNIISNKDRLNAEYLNKYIFEKQINVALLPPVMLSILSTKNTECLNNLLTGGESCSNDIVSKWGENRTFINAYGPTENTVIATMHEYKDGDLYTNIGKPLNNIGCYVLDAHNKPLPIGVIGELYIKGAGLAYGYLNQPELTAQKFISNPFATKDDIGKGYTCLYRTGDLVRWLPDGNLEYMGRNDFQVKIRGYRIEPGEIENALTSIEGVERACVVVKEKEANKYLVAYFVSDTELKEENILNQLTDKLPDYMVPNALIKMDSFPLTINGKLDRKALPNPEFTSEDSYLTPTTDLEIKLCNIWQKVLNLKKVGVTDDFFRIGGNSILAIKLSHQLSKALDSHVAVADVFKYKTVSSLVDYLNSNETQNIIITPQNLNKYPLSFAQERLWFIEQYEQGTSAYHVPMFVELHENTDKDKLKSAIQQIIQRHEVLRTTFKQEDGEYCQIIIDGKLEINEYYNSKVEISKQIENDINIPFDLQKDFPIRVSFYHKENRTFLLVNMHHIASDGWSVDILLKEINNLYSDKTLSNLVIQYKDYANWQREYLQGEVLQKQLSYWKDKLKGYEPLALPIDKARPKQIDYSGYDYLFNINGNLSNKLRNLSTVQGCSMYTTLLAGFYILLSKYTSQDDIVLGTNIANRHYSEIQDLIGFFVNSLALRENINQENNVVEFISQVQNSLIEAQGHQDLPFEKIVEGVKVERDTSRHPIFQLMFVVQSFGDDSENKLFKLSELSNEFITAKYDLSCFMDDSQNEIKGIFNFATALYEKTTMERMVNHYLIVLEQMVSDKYKQLKDYSLLTQAEYQQIVIAWNKTYKEYPKERTIFQLFEEQVLKTPNNIAIVFEQQQLTYKDLNAKANQLARYLRSQAVINPDTLVALCLDRSLEMLIGILGIMKAGGAYVPIDPEYPAERINYILDDTQTELVLTQSHLIENLQKITDCNLIVLDSNCYHSQDTTNLPIQNKARDLAYIIYTSGTTGKPKGAVVTHKLLVNRLIWQKETYNFSNNDIIIQKTPYVFDVSVWELLLPVISGSKLIFAKVNGHKDPEYLYDVLEAYEVTKLHFVPSMLNSFVDYLKNNNIVKLNFVEQVFCSGEVLPIQLVNNFKNLLPNIKLNNLYGPTEVAIDVSSYDDIQANINLIHIGKPIQNIQFYVLDSNNKPTPIGVIGELYIGGADLAGGYLNKPELTVQKFILNPVTTNENISKDNTRLYKTGDLVRWLPDGNLEYICRNDFQVKIRGYRIELGEIENALISIENIKQACVLTKEKSDNKHLVGYFVSDADIADESILSQLANKLPEYMVPSALVKMERFPLTINGKLDRKALPDPEFTNKNSYLAPAADIEIKLCNIWQEVLNLEKVGVTDDFFRIGGDSILSIQLSSRLRKENLNCSVRDIFDNRTIQKLATFIESDINETEIIAEQGILKGQFGLLPIQKWFFDKIENSHFKKFNHWNQSFLVKVPKLKVKRLQNIINSLTEQHDILRAIYTNNQQEYLSKIDLPQLECLNIKNLSEQDINKTLTNLQANFNINNAPLWNIAYIEGYQDNSARLFFAFHHLIVDAVSWRILVEDFKSLYNNENLENKSSSYRQWVNEVSLYVETNPQEKDYWNNVLKITPKYDVAGNNTALSTTKINKKVTSCLLQEANKAYHTEVNDLLLTALALTLENWNNEPTQAITVEGHGRENINKTIDHSKTAGWFTTMYPVILETQYDLQSSIKHIKESLRSIPNRGIGFGAIYPNELVNLPAISFNYLGQFDTQDEYWQVVSEDSGMAVHTGNIDSNIININGMVLEGELGFSVVTKLGKEETVEFAKNFQNHLEKIISHCENIIKNNKTQHTPTDFKTVNISQLLLDKTQKDKTKQIEYIFPANSLQQGFIYHALSQTEDDAYRVQVLFDYKQELNIENYIKSWELAIQKYPILRTAFNWEEEIIQIVYSNAKLNWQVLDISDLSETKKEEYIINLQQEDRNIAFDLTKPCLLRLYIIKQALNIYTVLKSEHHSIGDGWSGPILLNTIHKNYYNLQQNNKVIVEIDSSFLEAQNYFAKQKSNIEEYWKEKKFLIVQTNDLNPLLSKRQDLDNIKSLENAYDATVEITGDLYLQLKKLTKTEGFTLNTIVQFAWHKLIQVYTQDNQTVVGTTVSGRDIPILGIEDSVGLYINTLPLIINWDNENTVLQQIQYIHQQITDINTHSFATLVSLQQDGKRLFHSLLVFENYPIPAASEIISKDTLTPEFRYAVEKLDYPLGVTAYEQGNKLVISLKSGSEILDAERANYNLGKIVLLLSELLVNLDKKHSSMSTLTKEEYQQIVIDWNKTGKESPKDKTIYQLFEEQVLKTPDNIAVVFEEHQLTYEELNAKANQLAWYLQSKTTIKPDKFLALFLDRSLEMIIGLLGILKAGGAYVPIDIEYPVERINYILDDTQTELVLTQSHLIGRLNKITDLDLIELDSDCYQNQEKTNLPIQNKSTDLAYVIYTSGTTGKPKGVMNSHGNIISLVINDFIKITEKDSFVFLSSPVFDASVFEIWMPLTYGAKLIIPIDTKELVATSNNFISFLDKNSINIIWLTKTLFNTIFMNNQSVFKNIKYLLVGGEALDVDIINSLMATDNKPQYTINGYGPTESTTFSTTYLIDNIVKSNSVPIGKNLGNRFLFVLDNNICPVPVGVIGELCIGGAGLARGYLNKPEITAEKFITNPFTTKEDKVKGYTRLYKTGDLVRWLPDGNLEYIGRNDFQVKLRGYRIELGEIENALMSIECVKQACVLANEKNGDKHLVGYFVANTEISEESILKQLADKLPGYMVPSILVKMENFPLNINGKLDRKALPEPKLSSDADSYVAPESEQEIKLSMIWQEVLGWEKVGITDDFFQLGGNSLSAIKLMSKINSELKKDLQIVSIFQNTTIKQLSVLLQEDQVLEEGEI